MIRAILFVYGHGRNVNWGEWDFAALPSPGDELGIHLRDDEWHSAKVRHVEHQPSPSPEIATALGRLPSQPEVIIISDWYDPNQRH